MRARVLRLILIASVVLAGVGAVLLGATSAGAVAGAGGYVPLPAGPTRVLDTRYGTGGITGPVAGGHTISLGLGAELPDGASAVVLNLTVTGPTAPGTITAFPAGVSAPLASNLNFVKGQTVPNLAVVKVGTGNAVDLYNSSVGSVQIVADLMGYFSAGAPATSGAFGALTPTRLLDTRYGTGGVHGAVGADQSIAFAASAVDGIPAGVSAVVLNVTATGPTAAGAITAYPDQTSPPVASNLNYVKGQTVPNLVVVPVGADGKVALRNLSTGTVGLIADVSGYVLAGDPVTADMLGALAPVRVVDTRYGTGGVQGPIPGNGSRTYTVTGHGGVPLSGVSAVVINVTVTGPTAPGSLTVYAGTKPTASNLNWLKGQTVPNLVVAPVSAGGTVTFANNSVGAAQLIVDVAGYVLDTALAVPATSTSRYVRNVTASSPANALAGEGCTDAGSTLVVLDLGAQANDQTGVVLSVVDTKLTYAETVTLIEGYLDGFDGCASGTGHTIAIATNNDADDWTGYPAATRGSDFATKLIGPLLTHVAASDTHLAVVGADDIEPDFYSTESQAAAWESSFLAHTSAGLYFVGSADGCPTAYGATGTCAAGWTQAQLYQLAGGGNARMRALPQIYTAAQAGQWAGIDAVGGRGLSLAGALTEYAACPAVSAGCSIAALPPAQGWAALYHALSTVVATPNLPAVTDLRVDD